MAGKFLAKVQSCLPGSTPSVIACGDATFPKGTAFSGGDKVSGVAIRRPLGGAGCERSEQTEGVLRERLRGLQIGGAGKKRLKDLHAEQA